MARTKYYHADEVAELLCITIDEVRVMLKNKELKGHKLGRRWLIDMEQPCFEKLVSNDSITKSKNQSFGTSRTKNMRRCFVNTFSP